MTLSLPSLQGLRVVVLGLAREGEAVARFLAEHGASVTITDAKSAPQLNNRLETLADIGITYALGQHPPTLLNPEQTDLLMVSPGVPRNLPFIQQAQARGIPLSSEPRLFTHLCPAPVVGITGSSGKTTTTTLVGEMLLASRYDTHVGGNIGRPLILELAHIADSARVVMELSSFQLEYFHPAQTPATPNPAWPLLTALQQPYSPNIAAVLNITPNHLDRHGTMAAYTHAKQAIYAYQSQGQAVILSWDDPTTRQLGQKLSPERVRWFSQQSLVSRGACVQNGQITLIPGKGLPPQNICSVEALKLLGAHNIANVLAACAIAHEAGATLEAMTTVATSFTGVAHRLEWVANVNGADYYNDSIATSPERMIAAIHAFEAPLILLAGGRDKDLPWADVAQLIARRVKHLLLFGEAQDLIADAVNKALAQNPASETQIHACGSLERAIATAKKLAHSGDVVLLSPGCTSYDAFDDFAARGIAFRQWVRRSTSVS
jgi:UDP-N-acetylmuramoylalanine--D-glutamate ligase